MNKDAFSEAALQILQTAATAVADAAQAVKTASEAVSTSAEALKAAALAMSGVASTPAPQALESSVTQTTPVQAQQSVSELSEEELVAVITAAAADVLGVQMNQIQVVDVHEDHSWRMQGRNAIHHSHRLR